MSKFFRDYYSTGIALSRSKTDYSKEHPDARSLKMIEELQEYVDADDGADGTPLCMRSLCVKGEGHVGACKGAK